jgi:hypothetical protein
LAAVARAESHKPEIEVAFPTRDTRNARDPSANVLDQYQLQPLDVRHWRETRHCLIIME